MSEPSELESLQCQKLREEIKKLDVETRLLTRSWWQQASYIAAILPIVVVSFSAWVAYSNSEFKREAEAEAAKADIAQLRPEAETLKAQVSRLQKEEPILQVEIAPASWRKFKNFSIKPPHCKSEMRRLIKIFRNGDPSSWTSVRA